MEVKGAVGLFGIGKVGPPGLRPWGRGPASLSVECFIPLPPLVRPPSAVVHLVYQEDGFACPRRGRNAAAAAFTPIVCGSESSPLGIYTMDNT